MHLIPTLCKQTPIALIENAHAVFSYFDLRIIYWSAWKLEQIETYYATALLLWVQGLG